MMRGDYCGNGTSHTCDGTLIDIVDLLGIQLPLQATIWRSMPPGDRIAEGVTSIAKQRLSPVPRSLDDTRR
jgi:hypothetical protein